MNEYWERIFFKKKKRLKRRNVAYINETCSIDFNDSTQRLIILGYTGSHKTTEAVKIMSQLDNVLYFEPQGKIEKVLNFLSQESGKDVTAEWKHYHVGIKGKDQLQLNVADMYEKVAEVLVPLGHAKDRFASTTIENFCKLPREQKTFANFEALIKEEKYLATIWNDIKDIWSKTDKGVSLEELQQGKNIIDISAISPQNAVLGVLIQMIIAYRIKMPSHSYEPLLLCIDECEHFAAMHTRMGKAMGIASTRGRVYKINTMLVGVTHRKVDLDIKSQLTKFLIYSYTDKDCRKLSNEFGIDITKEDFDYLPSDSLYYINTQEAVDFNMGTRDSYMQETSDIYKNYIALDEEEEELFDIPSPSEYMF